MKNDFCPFCRAVVEEWLHIAGHVSCPKCHTVVENCCEGIGVWDADEEPLDSVIE